MAHSLNTINSVTGSNFRLHNGNNIYLNCNERDEVGTILAWLSKLPSFNTHEAIRMKADLPMQNSFSMKNSMGFTGSWLLDSDNFRRWQSHDSSFRKLWYTGMPGAGKSVLASIIVQRLLDTGEGDNSVRTACLFLSYAQIHDVSHLLGSVVKQLVSGMEKLPPEVLALWRKYKSEYGHTPDKDNSRPTNQELSTLLSALAKECRVYIVVDGLDEYPSDHRAHLVKWLQPESRNVRFLVISRYLDELSRYIGDFVRDSIKAHNDDLDRYIGFRFDHLDRLRDFSRQDPDLVSSAKQSIKAASEGMFLLARLLIDHFAAQHSLGEFRDAVQSFRQSKILDGDQMRRPLDEVYETTLNRILLVEPSGVAQDSNQTAQANQETAERTLSLLATCTRPLKLDEVQDALALQPGQRKLDKDRRWTAEQIKHACGGLIDVAEDTVLLVHYTAKDFLMSDKGRMKLRKAEATMAEICVHYLLLQSSELSGSRRSGPPTLNNHEAFPFLHYAIINLGFHLRTWETNRPSSTVNLEEDFLKLLRDGKKRDLIAGMLFNSSSPKSMRQVHDRQLRNNPFKLNHSTSKPSLLSYTYSTDIDSALESTSSFTSQPKLSALHLAAHLGSGPAISAILRDSQERIFINVKDAYANTALMYAIRGQYWNVVQTLLTEGASLDLQLLEGHSILLEMARSNGKTAVLEVISKALGLLDDEATIREKAAITRNSTERALYFLPDAAKAVKQKLRQRSRSARDTVQDSPGYSWTSRKSRARLWLLYAAANGEALMIETVFKQSKGSPNGRIRWFASTALFLAIEFEEHETAASLIKAGSDVHSRDQLDWSTPLHRATIRGSLGSTKVLLEAHADVHKRDGNGKTAWILGCWAHNHEILLLLERAGADPNSRDSGGATSLYYAAAGGHLETTRFMLEHGVDPSIQTHYGWAPLHWAAHNGNTECVKELLAFQAPLNPLSDTARTPLDMAIQSSHDDIVRILLNAGAQTATRVYDNLVELTYSSR